MRVSAEVADAVGRELRVEIAEPLLRRADGFHDPVEHFRVDDVRPLEERRLDADALLVDVPRKRHRPGRDAADVGVVARFAT